jgi:hypothetical protein
MTAVAIPRSTALTEAGREFSRPLTADEARELTAEIRVSVQQLLPKIRTAYQRRADLALGYASWEAYCDAELSGLRMSVADRPEAVAGLRRDGMSQRAIASALHVGVGTVNRDLRTVPDGTVPDRIVGTDGRKQPASRPAPKPTQTPEPGAAAPSAVADSGPDLTSDIERALTSAGPAGMTAWQLAFLIDPAGPDADRAELAVRMAPILEQLAVEGRACVVGEVDGGMLWALAELVNAQAPEPAAADALAAVAGSGAPSPAPESPASAPTSPAGPSGNADFEATLKADSARRAVVRNLTSVLTFLNPVAIAPAELAEREYAPVLDEFDLADLERAAATLNALVALKRGAR